MQTIAIVNEKGGTGKTTTTVNLAAALGEMGEKVLLVDLDGQAASSRWLGVEDDTRLADALLTGGGLDPIEQIVPGVDLAPGSGKLDSVAHDLRPTQGGQLRRVLAEVEDRYTYALIDCPPSLGNRLIGNALLAATHAVAPVEPSILALDGLGILLTTLQDIRDGFGHGIILIGALACRYDARTRLSRLVLAELKRALPGKVFDTVIHETVRMQECPASGKTILDYAPNCHAAADYRALARELVARPVLADDYEVPQQDLAKQGELTQSEQMSLEEFRQTAVRMFAGSSKGPRVETTRPESPSEQTDGPVPIEITASEQGEEIPLTQASEQNEAPAQNAADYTADEAEQASVEDIRADGDAISEWLTDEQDREYLPQADQKASEQMEMPTADLDPEDMMIDEEPEPENNRDEPAPALAQGPSPGRRKVLALAAGTPVVLLAAAGLLAWKLSVGGQASPQIASADSSMPDPPAVLPEPVAQPVRSMAVEAAIAELGLTPSEPTQTTEDAHQAEPEAEDPITAQTQQKDTAETTDTAERVEATADSIADEPTEESADHARQPAISDPPAESQPEPDQQEQIRYIDCPEGFSLTCIMKSPSGYLAMINGKSARVGQSISGAEVMGISVNSVEMELDGKRFTLGIGQRSPQ